MKKAIDGLTADLGESPPVEDGYAGPTTGTEKILAEVLADVVHVDPVSVDSNFFLDLGADSMVMARFCARVRKRADLPSVSMKDIYEYPTLRGLAASIAEAAPLPASADAAPVPVETILAEVMADLLHVDHVSADSNFFDDLGADSLDTVELVMAFEEEFGIEIPDDAAETIQTFGDAVKFISKEQ